MGLDKDVYAIIMAGGAGTRLWPYSRAKHPKQFLDPVGRGCSLLQATYVHMRRHAERANILVVTHANYAELVQEQLPELQSDQILAEPMRRNTAPCIAYASYKIKKKCHQARLIVATADSCIIDGDAFSEALRAALDAATGHDRLVTLGITPSRPETGYGYIQFLDEGEEQGAVKKVKTFTEKPERVLAEKFVESGDFLWNTGIFVWEMRTILRALDKYIPEISEVFKEGLPMYGTDEEPAFLQKAYAIVPNKSIDHAVLELHHNVHVVPCQFAWSDLGSWEALYAIMPKDGNQNVCIGESAVTYDSSGNLLRTKTKKVILTSGLKDYIVADFEDILVICPRENEAQFRTFVQDMKDKKGDQ